MSPTTPPPAKIEASRLTSIARSGLIDEESAANSVVARLIDYLSNQSSKALNYSHGYWTAGARDNNCFMLTETIVTGLP